MKFTVWTESVKLSELLSPAQMDIAKANKDNTTTFRVVIQNNHATLCLYVEWWLDATVASGIKLEASDMLSFDDFELDQINLISDWSNNEVRVLFS